MAACSKLRETKFFFQKLVCESEKDSPSEPVAFLYYLNAFLTAGESVRYFLEEDYGYERKKAVGILEFMNEQRRIVVHAKGQADVALIWMHLPIGNLGDQPRHPAFGIHFFAPPTVLLPVGQRTYVFSVDGNEVKVVDYCKQYIGAIETLVKQFRT
jgi:hypothetical protein